MNDEYVKSIGTDAPSRKKCTPPDHKLILNENQQLVLDWLKQLPLFPISAIHLLEAGKNVPDNVKKAYEDFDKQEERQLLAAFADWGEEQ